jgi:2-methylisocitrate lyase-like PEP mutase family enzyme
MNDKKTQVERAETFLALHHAPRLLVLPNIWNPLGARMLERLGYPAVATASAAVAYSLGYDDGERLPFARMLEVIRSIASSVAVPVTADIESGYSSDLEELKDNVRQVIRAGAVGINLEDSPDEGQLMRSIDVQCNRIAAARLAAEVEGVPLVINARIDTFLGGFPGSHEKKVAETIDRGILYLASGADCLYPIGPGDLGTLNAIREGTGGLINAYAHAATAPMRDLEAAGVSRLSLGPNLLKAAFTKARDVALALKNYGSYDVFSTELMPTEEIRDYVRGRE